MTARVEMSLIAPDAADELRRAVLRPHLPPGTRMTLVDQPGALHIGAVDGDAVIGTCVVFPEPYPLRPTAAQPWRLRAMAIDPARQGTGVGRAVVEFAVAEICSRDGRLLWCDARLSALAFYERLGFSAEGDTFHTEATGLPHRRMWRELRDAPISSE